MMQRPQFHNRAVTLAMACLLVLMASWHAPRRAEAETVKEASASDEQELTAADRQRLQLKLQEVLASQENLLQRLDAVLEELRIVKIRVSR